MKPASNDFQSLIGAAEDQIAKVQVHAATHPAQQSLVTHYLRFVAATAAIAISATQLAPLFHFSNSDRTTKDLSTIIEQARQDVEASRLAQGRLPEALSNAALASLVAYTPVGESYQLFAMADGVSVTLELNGNKTVKHGSAK